MWLFTPEGFYSVVSAEEFGHPLQVRARCDDDLDRLRSSFFPTLGENVHLAGRDYPVRAFTTHEGLAECLSKIAKPSITTISRAPWQPGTAANGPTSTAMYGVTAGR